MSEQVHWEETKNQIVGGMLYLVATPIGNLSDLSMRAQKVLAEVDFIAAEDTRNSLRLLTHFGIAKPMVSYHEHNRRERGEQIAARLLSGESCALITDAGTPAISDPGEDLVALCAERGIPVTAIPGACAGIAALTVSGLPTGRFVFEGFLPVAKKERKERLAVLAKETRTFLLHEAPHKLRVTLADLEQTLGGDRRIALCRELTKRNEEIQRITLAEAVACYETREPRGEYVLVVEGGVGTSESKPTFATVKEAFAHYVSVGQSRNEAVKSAAKAMGLSRGEVYDIMTEQTDVLSVSADSRQKE